MRAFFVRALPILALVLGPVVTTDADADTDPMITGESPAAPDMPEPRKNTQPARQKAAPPPVEAQRTPLLPADSKSAAARVDALFAELKRAPSHAVAAPIAVKIQEEWAESGSATVDLMMDWAGEAVAKDDNAAALDFLEQAIMLKPRFAEAWNRRATLHYVMSDFGKSIADIEKTLALEPRHWGALMGLGMILEETDRKPQALETYMRVLTIYPSLKGAQDAVGRLSEELEGQAI